MILLGLDNISTAAVIKNGVAKIKLTRLRKTFELKRCGECDNCTNDRLDKKCKSPKTVIAPETDTILVIDKTDLQNMLTALNEKA